MLGFPPTNRAPFGVKMDATEVPQMLCSGSALIGFTSTRNTRPPETPHGWFHHEEIDGFLWQKLQKIRYDFVCRFGVGIGISGGWVDKFCVCVGGMCVQRQKMQKYMDSVSILNLVYNFYECSGVDKYINVRTYWINPTEEYVL